MGYARNAVFADNTFWSKKADESSIDVPNKNHVDPNQYRYQDIGIGYSWGMTSYSFGNLVYNHFHGYDREKRGADSRVDSWNDFGVCVKFKDLHLFPCGETGESAVSR